MINVTFLFSTCLRLVSAHTLKISIIMALPVPIKKTEKFMLSRYIDTLAFVNHKLTIECCKSDSILSLESVQAAKNTTNMQQSVNLQ